ncbi:MAG TPA: GTP cyclohydrolase II [Deltaproteobacteria bacterium]|nr:GTP cyclohydrolase II [Deltaproteobacteria bacterium]
MSKHNPPPHGVEFVAETALPMQRGKYRVRAYRDHISGTEPLAIVWGDIEGRTGVPVRVHDECLTSEVLGSLKCDCKDQLDHALDYIRDRDGGVVLYLRQEGRGIGLANKIAAYALQQEGLDTVDANRALGLPDDARRYHAAAAILTDLHLDGIQLMTNNPRKIERLQAHGVNIQGRIPVVVETNPHSEGYIEAKVARMGHMMEAEDGDAPQRSIIALVSK